VKAYLVEKDFDVLGVVDFKGNTIGYIHKSNLKDGKLEDFLLKIEQHFLIATIHHFKIIAGTFCK